MSGEWFADSNHRGRWTRLPTKNRAQISLRHSKLYRSAEQLRVLTRREYLRNTIPELPDPDPPTYCHGDYTESMLLSPERDGERRTEKLRETFRTAYTEEREDWAFDGARQQRMAVYRLLYRLNAMACLPLWHREATPDERDQREQEHRAFVAQSL